MNEIVPGAFHWSARHPKIGMDVSSYFLQEAGALIDPMLPPQGISWFPDRPPRLIVLTSRHHFRDSAAFVEEFGIDAWCHEDGLHEFKDGPQVRGLRTGDQPAPGIEVLPMNTISPDDVVLGIDVDRGALAFGDSLVHFGNGRIGFVPDRLIGENPEAVKSATRDAAARLLDRDFEHLLFAHGDPIVGDGRRVLEQFLQK
jgi:hypothetical protein